MNIEDYLSGGGVTLFYEEIVTVSNGAWSWPVGTRNDDLVDLHWIAGGAAGGGVQGTAGGADLKSASGSPGQGLHKVFLRKWLPATTAIVIGAGGVGVSGNNAGGDGGDTSAFGVTAKGGKGGPGLAGGGSATGGVASVTSIETNLENYRRAGFEGDANGGITGGGLGGVDAIWGGSAGGAGEPPVAAPNSIFAGKGGERGATNANGNPGNAPGGAGSGARRTGLGSHAGGNGARGEFRIRIWRRG